MSDQDEEFLRELAQTKHGKTKGAISKTITEMFKEHKAEMGWEKFQNIVRDNTIKLKGGKAYESRDELYDRA